MVNVISGKEKDEGVHSECNPRETGVQGSAGTDGFKPSGEWQNTEFAHST
jgi:hypothetical protein